MEVQVYRQLGECRCNDPHGNHWGFIWNPQYPGTGSHVVTGPA